MAFALKIDALCVKRGERPIFEGLSFAVSEGEALVLTGPNGVGKTTLIRTIAGFLRPASGTIRLQGAQDDREIAEQCHYVGHANGSKASLTVAENVEFWCAYLSGGEDAAGRTGRRERIDDALETFGLLPLADIPAGYLSAGQKRRVGLARLLVARRPIWLLDEPTVSLDAASSRLLARLVNAHVAGGGIAIAATHLALGLEAARELRMGVTA